MNDTPVTPAQVRAARALLGWSQSDLAERSRVSLPTVKRLEGGSGPLRAESRSKIVGTLEAAGIQFVAQWSPNASGNLAGPGVRFLMPEAPADIPEDGPIQERILRIADLVHQAGKVLSENPGDRQAYAAWKRLSDEMGRLIADQKAKA